MGGGNSHRGFGLNQAGPRDPTTGFPLGGSALLLNNFELRFPSPTLPFVQDNMSFALFHDMGNVFTDGKHMLDSLLRWHQNKALCSQGLNTVFQAGSGAARCNYNYVSHAIGLGIRYKTPVGPVRLDLAYSINPPSYNGLKGNFQDLIYCTTLTAPGCNSTPQVQKVRSFQFFFSIGQAF